jgi:hypothetical protein
MLHRPETPQYVQYAVNRTANEWRPHYVAPPFVGQRYVSSATIWDYSTTYLAVIAPALGVVAMVARMPRRYGE